MINLFWGSISRVGDTGEPESTVALRLMSALAQSEGDIYTDPCVTLAQFPSFPTMRSEGTSWSLNGPLVIVADSRLDNRPDLCRTLGLPRVDTNLLSDSQLILEAFKRWGDACPEHLLGDFAFAIWDIREKRLFCARDHLGIKPFYYWHNDPYFCFANDIEGVLAFNKVQPKLNLRYVKSALLYDSEFFHPHHTFFELVHKLPAGQTLSLSAEKLSLTTYWDPANVPKVRLNDDRSYANQLRLLLQEAVRCRLNTYPLTGAHLSSGLDSSTVTVLAARLSSKPLTTFSWSYPGNLNGLAYDERLEIEELREVENINVHYTDLAERDILNAFNDITRRPQILQPMENVVLESARALGIHSLLSGWGGDECVSYYGRAYLSGLLRQGRFRELFAQLRGWSHNNGAGVWYRGLKRAVSLNLPESLRRSYNRVPLASKGQSLLPSCLSIEFRKALNQVEAYPWHFYAVKPNVKADQVALLTRGQITQRTEAWAAQATRFGLSYGFPLLDKRVVEFALGVPSHLYFHHGQTRYLFRQATKGILPDSIRLKTTKRDPALEQHYYMLLDLILEKGQLLEKVTKRKSEIEENGVLDAQIIMEGLKASISFRTYLEHPSGIHNALWLAFLSPETRW